MNQAVSSVSLNVGQATIGFADVEQFAVFSRASHGEREVAKETPSVARADFGSGNNHIQCGERFLDFEPFSSTPTGFIDRIGVFDHQPLVAACARRLEHWLDLLDVAYQRL